MLQLADPGDFVMVVKNLGAKKMDFTRQQQAHNQGVRPGIMPMISSTCHFDCRGLSLG